MKRKSILFLTLVILLTSGSRAFAMTDELIFTDPVQNTYYGRSEGAAMIKNLSFSDVPSGHWAQQGIVRAGSLNLVKGDAQKYNPSDFVTNEQAIAFVMRILDKEIPAQQAAANLRGRMPTSASLQTLWSVGYLNLAMQDGLITRAQYNNALVADQSTLDPNTSFLREAPATREQVAQWVYQGLRSVQEDVFTTDATRQSVYNFSDYNNIDVRFIDAVDALASNSIMNGDSGMFRPKDTLTRAQMAVMLSNMSDIYGGLVGINKKTGTIGGVQDAQSTTTGASGLGRRYFVRTADGSIDVLAYVMLKDSSPQSAVSPDTVVLKNGVVGGLTSLAEGDEIEYLVNPATNTAYYVQVKKSAVEHKTVQGQLQAVDHANRTVTVLDASGKSYTYPVIEGMTGTDQSIGNYVYISDKRRSVSSLPVGSKVELRLKNNICDVITYIGEPVVVAETRGVVTDNNPQLGYLSYIDNSGAEVTKYYTDGDIKVEKQPYYSQEDPIGYSDEVFASFEYDPRDASISDIEPGDIVFMRFDPSSPDTITAISASPNYTVKYGKIRQFILDGDTAGMLIEYENKQTAWFDLASNIFISKDGKPIDASGVVAGDWARILVNQALIGLGYVVESVKEMTIEGEEHFISNIVKGQVASIDAVQNKLLIQNAQTLAKTGWTDYRNVAEFSLAGKDIEYYNNNTRVSLDFVSKYLKRADGEVYVALENNFTGEKVKKVTFRTGRDELLDADTVVSTDGNGGFNILSNYGKISTDEGTIVRRYGRLVDGNSIMIPDYAVVSLNGSDRAAVVDIMDAPATSGVTIVRGRIQSVDDGKSFKVQSMSTLTGNSWTYTPVQREFAIDYNTLFIGPNGPTNRDEFIDYGDMSVRDKVYTIVVDGSRAARVIDADYPQNAVRGEIYRNDSGTLQLKNAESYNSKTGKWTAISNANPIMTVSTENNTIVVKSNNVVSVAQLVAGDSVQIMTGALPEIGAGMVVNGLIIKVEK